jgi:hypothetical protein
MIEFPPRTPVLDNRWSTSSCLSLEPDGCVKFALLRPSPSHTEPQRPRSSRTTPVLKYCLRLHNLRSVSHTCFRCLTCYSLSKLNVSSVAHLKRSPSNAASGQDSRRWVARWPPPGRMLSSGLMRLNSGHELFLYSSKCLISAGRMHTIA